MNPPGRRQEDDINIVAATIRTRGRGCERGDGQDNLLPITIGLGSDPLHAHDLAQPITGRNGDPGVVAHSIAVRGREDGQEWELGDPEIGNALRAGDGGPSRGNWALTPEMAVRRLLPVECERLQGFPDNWTAGRSDSARYRMLGNAVCVPVAEWIGRQLIDALTSEATAC